MVFMNLIAVSVTGVMAGATRWDRWDKSCVSREIAEDHQRRDFLVLGHRRSHRLAQGRPLLPRALAEAGRGAGQVKRPGEPVSVDEQVEAWLRHIEQLYLRVYDPAVGTSLPIPGVPVHLRDPLNDALKEHGWRFAETARPLDLIEQMVGRRERPPPGLTFESDNGGFWRPGADRIAVGTGGTRSFYEGTLYLVPDMPTTNEVLGSFRKVRI